MMINFNTRPQKDFLPERLIAKSIALSNNYDPDEDIEKACGFVLFDSSEKRVWLMATRLRLYSITDERTERRPRINWSISRSRLLWKNSVSLEIREQHGEMDLVDIGYRKANPFSPCLFTGRALEERIRALITERMY